MRRKLLDFASFLARLLVLGTAGVADFVAIALSGSSRLGVASYCFKMGSCFEVIRFRAIRGQILR